MEKWERLANAEFDIMHVLWEKGEPMPVKNIVDTLVNRNWKTQTAHVLLKRLENKNYIAVDRSAHTHMFRALITEDEYVAGESKFLVGRTSGSVTKMIAALIDSGSVGEEELAKISSIVSKKRKELKKGN